jgi:SOS-response transcriptional repressor LexA
VTLTPNQLRVAATIRNYRHLHGRAPTYDELGAILGVSKVNVWETCRTLKEKSVLSCGKWERSIGRMLVSLGDEDRHTKLPYLGELREGKPIRLAVGGQAIDLERWLCGGGRTVPRA